MTTFDKDISDSEGAVGGATGYDGYLKMGNKTTDYTRMSPAPPPPTEMVSSGSDHSDSEDVRYVNSKKWRREKADDSELVPLKNMDGNAENNSEEVVLRRKKDKNKNTTAGVVDTQADVHHQEDDSDSGHSSTYAPGTSPETGNDGYLIPKLGPDGQVFMENKKPVQTSVDDSFTSSGLHSDYRYGDLPPPTYSAVVRDSDVPV